MKAIISKLMVFESYKFFSLFCDFGVLSLIKKCLDVIYIAFAFGYVVAFNNIFESFHELFFCHGCVIDIELRMVVFFFCLRSIIILLFGYITIC